MDVCDIIRVNFRVLCRSLDPTEELLGQLYFVESLKDKICEIRNQTTTECKASRLLTLIGETCGRQSVLEAFLSALRNCGQEHVANVFVTLSDVIPLSDHHYRLIQSNLKELCRLIDPTSGLIEHLCSDGIFSINDQERIMVKATENDMARELVAIVQRKPDHAFDSFISALNHTGQEHIALILTQNQDKDQSVLSKMPMSDSHSRLLESKLDELCRFIITDSGLVDVLRSAGVLHKIDEGRIASKTTDSDKAKELINILQRKPNSAFETFVSALNSTSQDHVAYILTGVGRPPLKQEWIDILNEERHFIIEKMDPISNSFLSELVSKKVFTQRDAERVTGIHCGTDAERNEQILRLIARKSESSFEQFIAALVRTHQKHVAVKLVGEEVDSKMKSSFIGMEQLGTNPAENRIKIKLRNIVKCSGTLKTELTNALTDIGVHVTYVGDGSISVRFRCMNMESLNRLHELHASGQLDKLFTEEYCSMFADKGLVSLSLNISDSEFERCAEIFRQTALMTSEHQRALQSAADMITDKIVVSDELLRNLTLCKRRRQAIERSPTPKEQVQTMLSIVSHQPDIAFKQFVKALEETGQHDAAKFLLKAAKDEDADVSSSASSKTIEQCELDVKNVSSVNSDTHQKDVYNIHLQTFREQPADAGHESMSQRLLVTRGSSCSEVPVAMLEILLQKAVVLCTRRHTVNKCATFNALSTVCKPWWLILKAMHQSSSGSWVNTQLHLISENHQTLKPGYHKKYEVKVIESTSWFYDETNFEAYTMYSKKCRGTACIINNWPESSADCSVLSELLTQLHFGVEIFNELTAAEVRQMVSKTACRRIYERKPQCYVLFIIGEAHDELSIQAMLAADGCSSSHEDILQALVDRESRNNLTNVPRFVCFVSHSQKTDELKAIELPQQDLIVGFSHAQDFDQHRGHRMGYIHHLVDVFGNEAHNTDVEALLSKVNSQFNTSDVCRHSSTWKSTLRRKLFLFPGQPC